MAPSGLASPSWLASKGFMPRPRSNNACEPMRPQYMLLCAWAVVDSLHGRLALTAGLGFFACF